MKNALLIFCLMFLTIQAFSQKKPSDSDYRKHPYWIEMIKDPKVNYFEAIKAYELFWKGKKMPSEEDEKIGQDKSAENKDEVSRRERRERKREKELQQKYGLECKKFEHWKMMVKPYVQEDGSILSKEEQLKLWEQQRQQ
jgi:hypothetical protein